MSSYGCWKLWPKKQQAARQTVKVRECIACGKYPATLGGEYQRAALRTLSDQNFISTVNHDLMHAAMGLATESGELLDAIKKRAFYGKPLDEVNLIEELGDLMWYIAVACEALDTTIDAVCVANIDKLKRRYPHRFTSDHAINRDLSAEREALAGAGAK